MLPDGVRPAVLGSLHGVTTSVSVVEVDVGGPPYGRAMPMKVGEVIRLLERDGWALLRTSGSHRHDTHPSKPVLVTVAGKPSATLKPKTEASILKQAGLRGEKA